MTGLKQNRWKIFLILLSILGSLKMLFFAVGMDEEYQIVMSYRNTIGDRLFLNMWEPHQSSAFLCTLLMKPYCLLFGTTGIVLYLRACGTLLHLGISLYLYKVLKNFVGEKYAWLLSLLYYNIIPKQIILPEFGIMQVWAYTLLSLFLMRYYTDGRKLKYLVLAASALALNVLSYPSCLILFPFLLLVMTRLSGRNRWKDMGVFTLVCAIWATGYLGMLFCYTTPVELLDTLSHILAGDITHSLSLAGKLLLLFKKAIYMVILWGVCRLLAGAAAKWKGLSPIAADCLTILPACMIQLFCWVVLDTGYEYLNLHLTAAAVAGLCSCRKAKDMPDDTADSAVLLRYMLIGAVLSLLSVIYLTDITLTESIPHAMPAAVFGAALLILACRNSRTEDCSKWMNLALTVLVLTAILGKTYTLRGGDYSNILQSGGIMKNGPAAGTISNYIRAYIYNSDYEDWQTYIEDGDKVLVVVDLVQGLDTIQYLFKDVEISHYSVVNPTAYDERLLEYWTLYPEKSPNVIIVDCWYGDLKADPDSWIMRYIEEDFGYTQVEDGSYIRIYRK